MISATTSARTAFHRWFLPAVVVAGCIVAWQLWVQLAHVEPWILPAPGRVASAGWTNRAVLLDSAWTTLGEAIGGLVIGTFAGLIVAFVITSIPLLRRALWPVIVASQTVPVIVLAPLIAVWFGYGLAPKIVLVAMICFFPVTVATASGLASADPEQIELLVSFGAGPIGILRFVRIPASLGQVIAGVRIAAAYAVGDAVIGEYVGGTSGLGIFIDRSHSSYRTDQMIAGVAVIAVLSIVLFGLIGMIGRALTPWERPDDTFEHSTTFPSSTDPQPTR